MDEKSDRGILSGSQNSFEDDEESTLNEQYPISQSSSWIPSHQKRKVTSVDVSCMDMQLRPSTESNQIDWPLMKSTCRFSDQPYLGPKPILSSPWLSEHIDDETPIRIDWIPPSSTNKAESKQPKNPSNRDQFKSEKKDTKNDTIDGKDFK